MMNRHMANRQVVLGGPGSYNQAIPVAVVIKHEKAR